MDIDACASANTTAWMTKADAIVAASPSVAAFRKAIESSRIGTDVVAAKLGYFLTTRHIDSTHAFKAAATSDAEAFQATYVSGEWGPRRLAVEDGIGAVKTAVYGTLDLPKALGDATYGPYRIVRSPSNSGRPPIVLPHNSAAAYALSGTLDETRLCGDSSRWDELAALATCARGEDVAGVADAAWPELIARENPTGEFAGDLVEVVLRDGRVPMTEVELVRVSQSDFDAVTDAYLRHLTGTTVALTDVERGLIQIAATDDDGSMTLEVVG